jgi:hypothetical protein
MLPLSKWSIWTPFVYTATINFPFIWHKIYYSIEVCKAKKRIIGFQNKIGIFIITLWVLRQPHVRCLISTCMTGSDVLVESDVIFPRFFSHYSSTTKCPIVVYHSIYGFRLFLWFLLVIVLFVITFTHENKQRCISNVVVWKSTEKNNVLWRHVRGKQVMFQVIV